MINIHAIRRSIKCNWSNVVSYPRLIFIITNLTILIVVKMLPLGLKVNIRNYLFAKICSDSTFFLNHKLDKLQGFKFYDKKYVQLFLDEYSGEHEMLNLILNIQPNIIDSAQFLALKFSKNGGSGCGINSNDLKKNINWLGADNGHGCCSDHSQVFIALSIINGLEAREVHHYSHTFNEFFDTKLNKWLWIDPQFCLMAQNGVGEYLSLFEIHNMFEKKQKVNWCFFGTNKHQLYNMNPEEHVEKYFTAPEFRQLSMTMGNNVFEEDFYNKKLKWLSKDIRQTILFITGISHGLLVYDPHDLVTRDIITTKFCFFLLALCYFVFFFKKKSAG